MQSIRKWLIPFLCGILFPSCALYAAYGVYHTVKDINSTLTTINQSMAKVKAVIKEGKDLNRAAEESKLIGTLAERIPAYIRNDVEAGTKEKIKILSGDLNLSAGDLTENLTTENHKGAVKAYNGMSDTYNRFTELMTDLSKSTH